MGGFMVNLMTQWTIWSPVNINVQEGKAAVFRHFGGKVDVQENTIHVFYVLLTVHPLMTLGKWPTWCTVMLYNTFIFIILYMFRATLCSSSGGQILLIIIVLSVSDPYRWYYTRCCINTIWPPDDEHRAARNMYRIIIINVLYNVIVHQVGHLSRVHRTVHRNIFLQ